VNVAILGTGYVGLTTGLCLAYVGHSVTCVDVDGGKIERLCQGIPPIHEPGLPELMQVTSGRVRFSTDATDAIANAEVVFVAVGTPASPGGSPDLQYLRAAGDQIGRCLGPHFTVIVNKSTVPVGSASWIEGLVRAAQVKHSECNNGHGFAVASNPEFLREGAAISDSFYPDRIVVGFDEPRALNVLERLYRPIVEQDFAAPAFAPRPDRLGAVPLVTASLTSAELIKYAANAFLSIKVSFANEMGDLAERVGGDVTQVMRGIGLDARIGTRFLQAGLGWGGSCFGKDTAALVATGREYGLAMRIVQAARDVNYGQRDRVILKLRSSLKILKGRTVGILGLAFKPHTDDLRDSPALDIARRLIKSGVKVRAHDPVALENAKREPANSGIEFCDSVEDVVADADALVLATEWPEYGALPWEALGPQMRSKIVVDGRNFLDRRSLETHGFRYLGMGV
jgi:UDPglucose 6-dehydrogenase